MFIVHTTQCTILKLNLSYETVIIKIVIKYTSQNLKKIISFVKVIIFTFPIYKQFVDMQN